MLMHNRGSLMLELLIYIALLAFITASAFGWFSRSQRSLLKAGAASNVLMALYSATDMLVRDIRNVPMQREAWLRIEPQEVILRSGSRDIGWYVDKKTLYRIEGVYDCLQAKWRNKKRSIALQNIEAVHFNINQLHEIINYIDVTLTIQAVGMQHTIHERIYPSESII